MLRRLKLIRVNRDHRAQAALQMNTGWQARADVEAYLRIWLSAAPKMRAMKERMDPLAGGPDLKRQRVLFEQS